MLTHIRTSSWCELFCIWGYCTGDQGGFSVDPFMAMGIGPMLGRTQILSISAWNGNFIGKSHTLLIVETQNCVPLSFSSNGTCSLVAIRGKTKKKKVETQNCGYCQDKMSSTKIYGFLCPWLTLCSYLFIGCSNYCCFG